MIYLNDVLETEDTKSLYRVIQIDYRENEIWLFALSDATALPKYWPLSLVEDEIAEKKRRLFDGMPVSAINTPSPAAIASRDQAYGRIQPLVSTLDILEPSKRSKLIVERANALGCSPQTIYKDLRNWWKNGMTPNALLPRFHARGSCEGLTLNRGRPPVIVKGQNFQVTQRDKEKFETAIKDFYLSTDYATLASAYQRLLEFYYSYVDGENQKTLKPEGEYPSEQQFRYFCKKLLPAETVLRKKKGDAEYELNHRAKLGSLIHEAYTVGDSYEIDATIVDNYIVAELSREIIIGKPTLYVVVCRKSKLTVGFYLGLEEPSWPAAMQAIKSIAENKAALCERYGVKYDPEDWPAHGILPKEIIADRGPEMIGENSGRLADGLEVVVKNLPARRADQKPVVECQFKLIQRSIANVAPGYTPPENAAKRQGKHYELDACLTLKELTTIILRDIIRLNRSPRKGGNCSPSYALDGIQPSPINIWNTEVRARAGALPRVREEQIRFALLPAAEATVTREGIQLGGTCFYTCPEAISRGWMVIAGQRGSFTVRVSYDRRLVDSIYIHDDTDPTKFFVATLLDKCSDYRGLSFQEVEAIEYFQKVLQRRGEHISRQNLFDAHQVQDPVARKAHQEMKRVTKGKTRASRKKDIAEDRKSERRLQRQEDARLPVHVSTGQPTAEIIPLIPKKPAPVVAETTGCPDSDRDAKRRQKYQEMLDGK